MEAFEQKMSRGGTQAIQEASRFFMRDDSVHQALRNITTRLESLGIPYAIAGGMALVAHGYDRTTVDVDVLVSDEALTVIHRELDGLGYVPPFTGSKHLRDTSNNVRVEFLIAGQFPGDGKPKPVAFPDPATAAVDIDGIRYLRLHVLIDLKLASGMTNPGRIKDLADVQELIRVLKLGKDFGDRLNPYVRPKFDELRSAVEQDAAIE
jgi:hypothetical protein